MRRWIEVFLALLILAAGVLLAALWARSHRWADVVRAQVGSRRLELISSRGQLKITVLSPPEMILALRYDRQGYVCGSVGAATIQRHVRRFANSRGFGFDRGRNLALLVPHWFLIAIVALLTPIVAIPRVRRFSIRSLLVGVVLFALLLWMIVGR